MLQTELRRQTDLLADEKDTLTFTTSANWSLEKRISELEDKLKIKVYINDSIYLFNSIN